VKSNFKGFVKHIDEWEKNNVAFSKKDMYELAKKHNIKDFLIHLKDKDGLWYWKCMICGKEFSKYDLSGNNRMYNFQSKGAASQHLMKHNYDLVKHNRTIEESTNWDYVINDKFPDGKYVKRDKENEKY